MDVTPDTVTASTLLSGETATAADGVQVTGTLVPPSEPVFQAKTVTPTSSEQIIVPDGYVNTAVHTATVMSYAAGGAESGNITLPGEALVNGQTYRVLGRLDVTNASGTVLEYYDIDSEFVWNTTSQYILENGTTEYVRNLSFYKGLSYNILKFTLIRNLSGSWGWTLNVYFYAENASYDGLSQVTVNPIPSQYIVPSGTISITDNGTVDVTNYASASVSVSGGGVTYGEFTVNKDSSITSYASYIGFIDYVQKYVQNVPVRIPLPRKLENNKNTYNGYGIVESDGYMYVAFLGNNDAYWPSVTATSGTATQVATASSNTLYNNTYPHFNAIVWYQLTPDAVVTMTYYNNN